MSIVSLKEMLIRADKEKYAVGAFNIVNHLTARAVVDACIEKKSPVIIQMSVKTVKQMGLEETIRVIVPMLEAAPIPATLHLDHCTDVAFAKSCIDAGFPSVMIDASKKSLEENIETTRDIKAYGAAKGVCVEGELGAITGVEEDIVVADDDGRLADVDSSKKYTAETGVDAFAPAIGTAHGLYKGDPIIDFDRLDEIRKISASPLVIHGGTGLSDDTFRRLIQLGGSKINISTAVKIAYLTSIRNFLQENPDVSEPLKLDSYVTEAVKDMAYKHISLFGSEGKAW